jgi:hypothetical protein
MQCGRAAHETRFNKVKELQDTGQALNDISRETGLNWRTVAKSCNTDSLPAKTGCCQAIGIWQTMRAIYPGGGQKVRRAVGYCMRRSAHRLRSSHDLHR